MSRPVLNRADPNAVRIVYNAEISEDAFGCCVDDKVKESTYFWVMENRLEFNYPIKPPCSEFMDSVGVIYFDDPIVEHAEPVTAKCTGLCGGGDAIRLQDKCCGCIVVREIIVRGFKDGITTSSAINKQRDACLSAAGLS